MRTTTLRLVRILFLLCAATAGIVGPAVRSAPARHLGRNPRRAEVPVLAGLRDNARHVADHLHAGRTSARSGARRNDADCVGIATINPTFLLSSAVSTSARRLRIGRIFFWKAGL